MPCEFSPYVFGSFWQFFFAILGSDLGNKKKSFLKITGFCYCFVNLPNFFHAGVLSTLTTFGACCRASCGVNCGHQLFLWDHCACCGGHKGESETWANRLKFVLRRNELTNYTNRIRERTNAWIERIGVSSASLVFWKTRSTSCLIPGRQARKLCRPRVKTRNVLTRNRTWVVAATMRRPNH